MYLKAIEIEEAKQASNGKLYKTVTFQELSEFAILPQGQVEVKTNATPKKRTLWNDQDGLFHNMSVNDVTFGTIKRFEVEEYEIPNATGGVNRVSSFSGVQFRGESDDATCMRHGKKLRKGVAVVSEEAKVNSVVTAQPVAAGQEVPA